MAKLPSKIFAELMEQHAGIRRLIVRCETTTGPALWEVVDDLRVALDAHNRYEERMLLPLLPQLDAFGDVRIEQMIDNHIHEHLAMNEQLRTDSPAALRVALDRLLLHLESEERYFVTPRLLRDDIVTLEGAG